MTAPHPQPTTATAATTVLTVQDVHAGYPVRGRRPGPDVLRSIDLTIPSGQALALVGTNGCGKSTLLQVLGGGLAPRAGRVYLADPDRGGELVDRTRWSARAAARQVALMHQTLPPMPGVTVRRLVEQGRYPHRGPLGMLAGVTGTEVDDALAAVDLVAFADRPVDRLSGGERQRARLALALAQQPRVLLLDEPTAHLDLAHQLRMLHLIDRVRRERGLTAVVVLHDLDHAARFTDRIVAVRDGRVVMDGPPAEVVTAELLADVFGVRGRVVRDDRGSSASRIRCLVDDPTD
ncbi:ABC transporter ATP-binding protein [Nakamurella flava]|uniref:ABC transporter ATP-binding protein n=1 Tax=Nakamurella flava TaxID=2576308 RepID=A0A4V6CRX2_9ACTN|nr:ABC transporter ATP-binding protein [Nakamurella flava]TKV59215.1 ABC transporter ATP-binding protein [Nakamurella flava]